MISALLMRDGQEPKVLDMPYLRARKAREEITSQHWQCKFCGTDMSPRMGAIRAWYFFHKSKASECPFEVESERESPQHQALKRAVYEALKLHLGEQVDSLEYEVRFPIIRRIAKSAL